MLYVREQKENKTTCVIAGCIIFILFMLYTFDTKAVIQPDGTFLYNRLFQVYDCFRHGEWPFLFYNDLDGIGYGSSIFYGWVTLIPFIPFVGNISAFLKVYFLCCVLLNFFAFRACVKRFSSYATLAACFYIIGVPFVMMSTSGLYAATMATGFSWLFFAYSIDFFRGDHSVSKVLLFFYLIFQTNINSAVLALVVCFCLFICYFSRSRLFDYFRLFACALLLLSFNIVDIIAHRDSVSLFDMSVYFGPNWEALLSAVPIGSFLVRSVLCKSNILSYCTWFMQVSIFVLFIYYYVRGIYKETSRFKVQSIVLVIGSVLAYIVGVWFIWPFFYYAGFAFLQFPLRYLILLWGGLCIVFSRVVQARRLTYAVLVLCLLDVLLANPVIIAYEEVDDQLYLHAFVVNGEYLGDDFVRGDSVFFDYSSRVHSTSGTIYTYQNTYNGLSVDCHANTGTDVLTLPKLYYNWYRAVGSDCTRFRVKSGYSNYCEIDIGNYTGILFLSYQVPMPVLLLFWVQIACLSRLLLLALRRYFVHAKAEGE